MPPSAKMWRAAKVHPIGSLLAWPSRQNLHGSGVARFLLRGGRPEQLQAGEARARRARRRSQSKPSTKAQEGRCCRFLIDTVAQRAVAEPENTDGQQIWPSCFVEKGYQRVTKGLHCPNDQAAPSQRSLPISFRPPGSADPTGTCCCVHPRPFSGALANFAARPAIARLSAFSSG
jgi:hypothetical protein